jgi:hypothetical protein
MSVVRLPFNGLANCAGKPNDRVIGNRRLQFLNTSLTNVAVHIR